jgi:hypothetical protein
MNYKFRCIATFGCLSVLGGMLADVSIAQQSRSDAGQLEEIVVTAEKRETTVDKTPISLTAISGGGHSEPRAHGPSLPNAVRSRSLDPH